MAIGALEILLVLFVVLLILGPRRIADLGRALGRGVRDFKLEFGRDQRDGELPGGKDDEKPARRR
ncbi:MAG: twin-arginine translocase TatA/TatE family subunit [Actinomycetota bacterium]|nr:twin-arginine translocase TatA/TatE family subunit [Actinomycetota bacterium]MDQ3926439.1 twin-arginine translocase TatA/TatE family subunit [Actinomycetota bacterium]